MTRINPVFSLNSMKVLCKRYLKTLREPTEADKNTMYPDVYAAHECTLCGKHHETPYELIARCSFGQEEFHNLLASLDFLPNSPTLFNAGTGSGTFSGCFKFSNQDSLEDIMHTATKSALVQKWGGGVGYCFSDLRAKGSPIKSTQGKACGPISVMDLDQAVAKMITQGGKRNGAQMAILHCTHPDILEFIHCKHIPDSCHCKGCELVKDCERSYTKIFDTFNISVAATDKFMEEATDPSSEAGKIFEEIVQGAWKNGDPGLYFIDTAERANPTPWLGKLDGTNPCGEVPLLDNEACLLGNINLAHMIKNGAIDKEKLEATARLGVRYLDTVLDNNKFPVPEIGTAVALTRKLGMGVMGWADALAILHIQYDTDAALALADTVMRTVQIAGHLESEKLAKEKGYCPAFLENPEVVTVDKYNSGLRYGVPARRNATVTCIAPTGTVSILAGCSAGIEPYFTLAGARAMGDGTILEEKQNVASGAFKPKTAREINYIWHIKHQAVFQKYTDLAVSKTINLPETATPEDIRKAYIMAWESGCKGITVYRDNSKFQQIIVEGDQTTKLHSGYGNNAAIQQTENVKKETVELYPIDASVKSYRRKMPKTGPAMRHSWQVGSSEGYLHTGLFPEDNKPGEIFITESNSGSTVAGLLSTISIITSLALQYGVPLETLVSKLQHINFEPKGLTSNPEIPHVSSVVAYIFRFLESQFLIKTEINEKSVAAVQTGMLCDDCGAMAITEEGCLKCSADCGWSRCG